MLSTELEEGVHSERDKTEQSLVNWVDNTFALRRSTTVVYRTDRRALSTARFCRAGRLATADTCVNCWLQFFLAKCDSARHKEERVSVAQLSPIFTPMTDDRLLVPSVQLSTVGGRAFPVAGPTIWNSLPDNVISAPSLSTFRQRLKTLSVPGLVSRHYRWSAVNYSPPPVDPEVILLLGPL